MAEAEQRGAAVLHVLPVGGGIVALSPLPGAAGDFRGNLEHVTSLRPAFVVCLATQAEMEEVGARSLPQAVQDKGTRWLHVPVMAAEAPSAETLSAWTEASAALRRALAGGGRVVVYSRAGAGRAGMLVLRLMIEAGEAPDEAETRLVAVHPGAVVPGPQRDWALAAPREAVEFRRHPDEARRAGPGSGKKP
ncbi:protein phosphatase [Ponticoccus sp. (in: a-proteobacteria)]|uniref:protein phosphatase n=1 Tax=Ponticoccus sp. (in: a-proteobacteria) TaxID=1925025 RepID=UPI003AB52834